MNTISLTTKKGSGLAAIMTGHEDSILTDWLREMKDSVRRSDLLKESELRAECSQFLRLIKEAIEAGGANFQSPAWEKARQMLNDVSRNRARQGFTPVETASFVFSAKRPLFTRIRQEYKNDVDSLASEMWAATELLDTMGLYTFEVYQKAREEVIRRQQEELLELSTPVVKLWEGVLALPIIGTLDSARTQVVMESLLQAIVETDSRVGDYRHHRCAHGGYSGRAAPAEDGDGSASDGADCIISGIRPQIAQTIVHLGIDLCDVTTKATCRPLLRSRLQTDRCGDSSREKVQQR